MQEIDFFYEKLEEIHFGTVAGKYVCFPENHPVIATQT